MRVVKGVSTDQIALEWDVLAPERVVQLVGGLDLSWEHVQKPAMMRMLANADLSRVLDVGCGVGFLSAILASSDRDVVGVDVSPESIRIANERFGDRAAFVCTSVEEYAKVDPPTFSSVVCNMSLMTVASLDDTIRAISRLTAVGGTFAFTICHPCYWPRYREYETEDWFNYNEEIFIEYEYRNSMVQIQDSLMTHVHRPIGRYISALASTGFLVEALLEPVPDEDASRLYPTAWVYPRFMGIRARRV